MSELPYAVAQLRGGARTGQLRHAVHPGQHPGLEQTMCGRPARVVDGSWHDTFFKVRCTRCMRAVAANEADRRLELDVSLDGLYLVCFGTRMEVVRGPSFIKRVEGHVVVTHDHVRAVVGEWIVARFPVRGDAMGNLRARYAPPLPEEVGCRPLTGKDMDTFATWDPAFANKVKRLMKKKGNDDRSRATAG